jgi:predicted ATPase
MLPNIYRHYLVKEKYMHLQRVTFFPDRFPTDQHYPFNQAIFQQTPSIEFSTPVTFFAGENGTGKSTLLKALGRKCGIHIWHGLDRSRCTHNPYEDHLHQYIGIEWTDGPVPGSFFASDLFHDFAQLLDEWATDDPGMLCYFGGHSLLTQSHGQSLMSFFRSRYTIPGLYFLDEPETALSPKSQVGLLHILQEISAAGHAQFLIATHSPILLACPNAAIFNFDTNPISPILYEDTEHYRIYKDFLNNPQIHLSGDNGRN